MWYIELPLYFKGLIFNLAIGRNDFCCRTLEISVCWPESPNLTSTLPSSDVLPPFSLMDMSCSVASCRTRTKLDTHSTATGSNSVLWIIKERRLRTANSFKYTQENTSDIFDSANTSLLISCSDLFFHLLIVGGEDYCFTWPHSVTRTTVGRTPLHEGSARRRDLYLTTHNTHNRQTSMPPAGFETTIPGSELP